MRTIVWFRGKDLRLSDHAPLCRAAASGEVLPLFVLDPYFFAKGRARGIAHRIQFLLESLRGPAADYAEQRDRMDLDGTSRLSADLKFGTLSVRQLWAAVDEALGETESARAFRNELIWRVFTHSTLWNRPELMKERTHQRS